MHKHFCIVNVEAFGGNIMAWDYFLGTYVQADSSLMDMAYLSIVPQYFYTCIVDFLCTCNLNINPPLNPLSHLDHHMSN